MRLHVKGRNVEVSDSIRSYAEAKLAKLEKLVKDPTRVEVELHVEKNPSIAKNSHVAEATIYTKGPVLHARESSADMKASIDQLVDKLERQVKRYREKRRRGRPRHGVSPPVEEAAVMTETDSDANTTIVKTKQFAIKPMTPEEAVLQLDLIGHDFFVFRHAESEEINVVYRRRDGNYGLIEPQ
jgi:putative sigma-54 modulation protein